MRESRREREFPAGGREERAPIHSIVRHGKKTGLELCQNFAQHLERKEDLLEIVGVDSPRNVSAARKM